MVSHTYYYYTGYTSELNSSVGGSSSSSCRRKGQKKNPSVAPVNTSKSDMASSKITNSTQEMVYQVRIWNRC